MTKRKPRPPVPTRQLTNEELGDLLGVTPSFASLLRNGLRLPGPAVQRAIVRDLGATWEELNDALDAAKPKNTGRQTGAQEKDTRPMIMLLLRLSTVPVEADPATVEKVAAG